MSGSIADSGDTGSTAGTGHTHTTVDASGANLPLGKVPYHRLGGSGADDLFPQLPSHRFQFSVWHDLKVSSLKGDELHAPRVREGPPEKDETFYKLQEEGELIHHSRQGKDKLQYRNKAENWENAQVVNLSYQDLSQKYQRDNFMRVLKRMIRVESLNLVDNTLTSLKGFSFPVCECLNVNKNYIDSFQKLPVTPRIKYLSAEDNDIADFHGLEKYRSTPIEEICLRGNPITFLVNYRPKMFKMLPQLKVLDNIPKLPADSEMPTDDNGDPSSCVII